MIYAVGQAIRCVTAPGGWSHGDGLCESSRNKVRMEGRSNLDEVYGTPSTWVDFQKLDGGILMFVMLMDPMPISLTEPELRLNFRTGACNVSRLSDMICPLHLLKLINPLQARKLNEQTVIDAYKTECC